MAFYKDEEEEGQDPASQQGGVSLGGETATLSPGAGGGGQGPMGPQGAAGAPDKSGNFVGITKYLNANKPQAAKLGDQAAGVIDTSANQARDSVNTLNQEADEKIKGTGSLGADILGRIKTGAETLSDQERDVAKKTAAAQYTGPKAVTDLSNYQGAQKATQTATQNIQNSGTEEGRMGLISQINSKPRTQGMNVFDNALLQAGGGREKLSQAAERNKDVPQALDLASQNAQTKIGRADDPTTPENEAAGAIGQTAASKDEAYKTIQDSLAAWKQGFQPKVTDAQNRIAQQRASLVGDVGDNQLDLDQETLDLLGIRAGQGIYDLKLADYLGNTSPSDITAEGVAGDEDFARDAALSDLAGQAGLLDQSKRGEAGKAPTLAADKERLRSDLTGKEQAYQQAYTGARGGSVTTNSVLGAMGLDPANPLGAQLFNATPQEIEQVWIPKFANGSDGYLRSKAPLLEQALAKWKGDNFSGNVVNLVESGKRGTGVKPGSGIHAKGGA